MRILGSGLAIALAMGVGTPATAAPMEGPKCGGAGVELGRAVDVVEAWRAYPGADGASKVERVALTGTHGVFMGGQVKLTQFDLGDPSHVSLSYGYPNIVIPPHPAPYREIFIILSGSSEMVMPDGQKIALTPGTMFIADDVGVTKGRSGSAGPCGYVALDLQFSPPPLPKTTPSYDKK